MASESVPTTPTKTGMLNIVSSDGEVVEVPIAAAIRSVAIKHVVEDLGTENPIPTRFVSGEILKKLFEHCTKHAEFDAAAAAAASKCEAAGPAEFDAAAAAARELMEWDKQYLARLPQDTIFNLILAANYLDVKDLMDLCCEKVADQIKTKSPEEVRRIFNIENDLTPEEEEEIRRKNKWAFQ